MIILDTDHLSLLQYRDSPRAFGLQKRLERLPVPELATTVISLEEQMRGWLRSIRRARQGHTQVPYYEKLTELLAFYRDWTVLPFDQVAANKLDSLRKERVNLGTMDLKIAAITLVNDATLLSGNLKDFRKVPGLRVEDWLRD